MPNKKKSSKKKEKSKSQKNLNAENLSSLKRLSTALASLDDKGTFNSDRSSDEDKIGLNINHWRDLDDDANHAYKMLNDGTELIKATSTKYTLVGKINVDDGSKFSDELRQGCELISTAALLVHQPSIGCSRSLRKYIKQHSRGVVTAVISLIESFESMKAMDKNIGAQNTGIVWSQCDDILTKLPKGNRAAMRREIFTWVGDCNETMQEFQEIVNLGPASENDEKDDASSWDDFCEGAGDQYSNKELEIVKACLAIIKCSRGILGLVMKACECAGNDAEKIKEEGCSKAIFQWISNAHELSRAVGKNVTDLGMCLYPSLNLTLSENEQDNIHEEGEWIRTEIGQQIVLQTNAIKAAANYVHDHIVPEISNVSITMSDEVMELASKLLAAIDVRKMEAKTALNNGIETIKN